VRGTRFLLQTRGGLRSRAWRRQGEKLFRDLTGRLERESPFGFARFNDGEMGAILGDLTVISRGQQKVAPSMRDELRESLQTQDPRVVIGIPCPVCYPTYSRAATRMVTGATTLGPATALQNQAHSAAASAIIGTLRAQPHRPIHWLGSAAHDLSAIETAVGRNVHHWKVPDTDAFELSLAECDRLILSVEAGAVVLLSCGPASRVAAVRILAAKEAVTAIDIGSLFDPLTRGIRHGYHSATSAYVCTACEGPTKRRGAFSFSRRRKLMSADEE